MALAMARGTEAGKILDSAGVRPQTLNGEPREVPGPDDFE